MRGRAVAEAGRTSAFDDPCLVLGDVAVLLAEGGPPGPALQALQSGLGLTAVGLRDAAPAASRVHLRPLIKKEMRRSAAARRGRRRG